MSEYTRTERNLVHKGSIVDFYSDTILLPDGVVKHYDFIAHKGAAAVLPVLPDGRILMVRQYRNAIDRYSLEIPAGARNDGEDFATAAKRELEEETGYATDDLIPLFELNTTVAFSNEKIGIFLAEHLTKTAQHLDDDEYLCVEAHTLEELIQMIFKNEIPDAKTICALMSYKAMKAAEK